MDDRTVVLYGERLGHMPMVILVALLAYGSILPAVTLATVAAPWMRTLLLLLPAVAMLAFAVWGAYRGISKRRRFMTEGGRIQLVVGPRGVSRRRGPGEPQIVPWARVRRYRLRRYYRWRLRRSGADPVSWILTFSSSSIFDPVRQTGSEPNPLAGDRAYINLVFNATPAEADRLRSTIDGLFESTRPDGAAPRAARAGDAVRRDE